MSLFQSSGLFRGVPRSGAGHFALGGKVTKTPPAPFGPDHRIVQSDACKGDTRLPLKYCGASGSLVIGAVSVRLRLTALGLRGGSFLLAGG